MSLMWCARVQGWPVDLPGLRTFARRCFAIEEHLRDCVELMRGPSNVKLTELPKHPDPEVDAHCQTFLAQAQHGASNSEASH